MAPARKPRRKGGRFLRSSQLRYAAAYILITAVVLLFLNIYAPITIRNLTFSAQGNAMNDKAQLVASAFSSYEQLDRETVSDVIRSVNDLHTSRMIITDPSGMCLFDSLQVGGSEGKLVLFPEVAEALSGSDVINIRYESGRLISKASIPIMAYNRLIGAVYLMENDTDQATLISQLERNIRWVSIALEAAIILFSLFFAAVFSRRLRKISVSVRQMHDGDYSARLDARGRDEISDLSRAFNDLAERLNQSEEVRKQFVSNASHELKTPLASIKLLSDSILQNEMDPSTTREFVADIGDEADRLTRLSAKLLELTRLDSHPSEERELVEIGAVALRVLRMLTPLSRSAKVRMELDCAKGCTVLGTEDDLYQILFNLVENGIKYNRPEGTVSVTARHDGEYVTVEVADTGSGIPEEAKPHVFERFYRVDKARSRKAGGAGLGLSIVHDMVRRNDGEITVLDREGGGTVFSLVLPLFSMTEEGEE